LIDDFYWKRGKKKRKKEFLKQVWHGDRTFIFHLLGWVCLWGSFTDGRGFVALKQLGGPATDFPEDHKKHHNRKEKGVQTMAKMQKKVR